ncbi:pirin family protein [Maribacter sp. 4G9]|uniref:pirin family protein n=1 Tax=Maribacter sp. 4G9 TaxID=1889777 RepID=UPI000C15E7EC|nr:pirin family protein [Maribacter sp. 4G9]PIB27904.1 pirin [Maribacter sp. 4G9]
MSNGIVRKFPLGPQWQTQDPFLFCVHHLDHFPEGTSDLGPAPELLKGRPLGSDFNPNQDWRMYHGQTIPGFPAHPHVGFETVTLVNQGFCDHSDSLGAAGRFGLGDTQWMTAGSGVQHSEMFPLLNTDKQNTLELFQIWLNLPKKSKFADPHFKMLWHEDIPVIETENATITVIAGNFNETLALDPPPDSWASEPENMVAIWNIHIEANGELSLPKAEKNINRSIYFYEGDEITLGSETLIQNYGADVDPTAEISIKAGSHSAKILVLQGAPIEEPVAQQGPFVMTTREELQKAFSQFRLTQFGGWPWPYPDNVHPAEKGRFAKYPDGTIVEKS